MGLISVQQEAFTAAQQLAHVLQEGSRRVSSSHAFKTGLNFFTGAESPATIAPNQAVMRLLFINTLLIAASVTYNSSISWREMGAAFREGHLMTWVSFFQLLLTGFIAANICAHLKTAPGALFWRLLSIAFIFLAFDELLHIHENLDGLVHRAAGVKPSAITDHLDDLIIVLYGAFCAAQLWRFPGESKRLFREWRFFALAIFCAFATTVLDAAVATKPLMASLAGGREQLAFIINVLDCFEETVKIFAEVFFIGAFAAVLAKLRSGSAPQSLFMA